MEKNGVFIFLTNENVENGLLTLYSFLKHNIWFNGDIIICHIVNEIDDSTKKKFVQMYNQTIFVDITRDDYIQLLSVYNKVDGVILLRHLSNEEFSLFDRIFVLNHNVLVANNITHRYDEDEKVIDITQIDGFVTLSYNGPQENITVIGFYSYDGEYGVHSQYCIDLRDECLNEMLSGGPFYELTTFDVKYYFPKKFSDRNKYVVFTCAKNENDYIVEWVQHYLQLGFDKIFLCDNNTPGDKSLYETLKRYVDGGFVEIFDCSMLNSFQVQFYSAFCTEGNYAWCGYFDCDEFLEIPSYFNVKHYLNTKKDEYVVSFHWMVYGANGALKQENGTLFERFKYPVSPISIFTENCFVKSLVKGGETFRNGCWFNGSHIPMTTPMYIHNVGGHFHTDSDRHCYFPPRYKDGYIRHYYTKSFDEWARKSNRGWPDGTASLVMGNFFVCEDWANLPLEKMRRGLFSEYRTKEENYDYYSYFLGYSDILNVCNPTQNIYGLLLGMYNFMHCCSGVVLMLGDDHIDDTTFNMVLEYGIKTGNKVVWAKTEEEKMNVVKKYSKISDTYYNINFD